jgi:hypothetical protein
MSDYATIYAHHFDKAFGELEFSKAARALKAYVVFLIDSNSLEDARERVLERTECLEKAAQLMDFTELGVSATVVRYVRKRLKASATVKWGAGLSRDPTAAEQQHLEAVTEAFGTSVVDTPAGVKKLDGFVSDLRDDDSDSDEA